jgi:hypothetical protein
MKKILIALLPIVLLVAACSKEKSLEDAGTAPNGGGSGAGYFLKCKIDGVDKTFNNSLFAIKLDTLGAVQYAVFGAANADPSNMESFTFAVSSPSAITTGTTYTVEDTSFNYVLVAVYNPNSQSIVFQSGTGDQSNSPFKLTITSVSATEISGTFQGTIFQNDAANPTDPNPPTKLITAGEFKAKFL